MTELPFDDDVGGIDRKVLHVLAKDAIQAGRLPTQRATIIRGGRAQGTTCTVCLMPVSPQAVGFTLEFEKWDAIAATHVLHIPCFEAWEAECEIEHARTRATNGAQNGHANGSVRPTREDSR
jgi:hypothetical protein